MSTNKETKKMTIVKGKIVSSFYDGNEYSVKVEVENIDEVKATYEKVNWNSRFKPDFLNDEESKTINLHSTYPINVYDEKNNPIEYTHQTSQEIVGTVDTGVEVNVAISPNGKNTAIYPRAFKFFNYRQREVTEFNPFI